MAFVFNNIQYTYEDVEAMEGIDGTDQYTYSPPI